MVYNFNLGIGWASSGVEYAQSYRANLLRRAHIPATFICLSRKIIMQQILILTLKPRHDICRIISMSAV